MRKLYLFFAFVFFSVAYGQAPFITTWDIPELGDKSITIPIVAGEGVNYTVNFGDGVILTSQTGPCTHTYASDGNFTVTISGSFNRIHFGSLPNPLGAQNVESIKLVAIQQWGDTQWTTMEGAFENCMGLAYVSETDMPDLSQVTSLRRMFYLCTAFSSQSNLNSWDVSNVTNMEEMFAASTGFNQPLNDWDVSNVTNMKGMFLQAFNFNRPLNNWDVSNVLDMSSMFAGARSFNQPINNWNVSSVTNMSNMFDGSNSLSSSYVFNQPLNNWDVSNVVNMNEMFKSAKSFNQPLNDWDVSGVTNMKGMFRSAKVFNQPLSNWDVSNVTDMSEMFYKAEQFNQEIGDWNVSSVATMNAMFREAKAFNSPLNDWDVSNVTDAKDMFYSAIAFNRPLNNWNVSSVTTMENMFRDATQFNGELNGWNPASTTKMSNMFNNAVSFNQPINEWNVSNVHWMDHMFQNASSFNRDLSDWEMSNVIVGGMFLGASNFDQDLSDWNFNTVYLDYGNGDYRNFVSESGLSSDNYDALLLRFVQLQLDGGIGTFVASGLEYCDSGVRQYLIDELDWHFSGDSLGAGCQGNTLSGSVHYDTDANGCDGSDLALQNFIVNASDGTFNYIDVTDASGAYSTFVLENSYATSILNVPEYFTVTPQSQTVAFAGYGNVEEINFCLTANQPVQDLNIRFFPLDVPRPGFASQYQLIVENIGTQTVPDAAVSLAYDNAKQSFTSAVPAAATATAGQLTFNLANLQPFESRTITITMQTFTPPTVNGGDIIEFTAAVTPDSGDYTPADNNFVLAQTVVNSFDPNDKEVLQGDEITMEQAEGYLDYIVRFQNTGTASALTVRIEDHLPENVDWTTLRPISSSHPYKVKLKSDNTIEFIFENINLPHEAANEPGSHGFIAYKVKPMETVAVGDILTGNAEIFFDYNLPIVTNFATTEIVEIMGVAGHIANNVSIYPNPVSDVLNIRAASGITVEEVKVINLQGRELMSFSTNTESINVENLSAGVYMLMIKTNAGHTKHKLVRK